VTSCAGEAQAHRDAPETATKMRVKIRDHLKNIRGDSAKTLDIEAKYEKIIQKLEKDLREKLSVSENHV
jgi:hypothetical protein